MSKRISLIAIALLAFAMSWVGVQKAVSQGDDERKQTLVIGYPNPSIMIGEGKRYGGIQKDP